jgi:hypothetical protein
MEVDRNVAEKLAREYLRQYGRFDGVEIVVEVLELPQGWQIHVEPAKSYLKKHRPDLRKPLFVDRTDGRIWPIPSYGAKLLVAKLRGQL